MIHRSQKDPRYAKLSLGTCAKTFSQIGCLTSCYSMLSYIDPVIVNQLFIDNNVYENGCSIVENRAVKVLGLKYDGRSKTKPNFVCIAETDYYKPWYRGGVPQHFFIFLPLGDGDFMIDPLDTPEEIGLKPIKYPIVSFRLVHEKKFSQLMPKLWNGERPDEPLTRREADIMFSRYNQIYG